jgi:sterol 3beta-glucosyltransferase
MMPTLLSTLSLFTAGGHSLARKLNVPDISVQTFPIFAPTCAFPPVSTPNLPSGLLSYFFHWLTIQVFKHGGNIGFRRLRKADPETFDLNLHWPFTSDDSRLMTPLVLAYSPTVIPRPDDWPAPHIHIPGYLFLDPPTGYQLPDVLAEFLSAGEPPVCVTFGSMIRRDAERIYHDVLSALGKTGNRAVILSGWSNLQNFPLSESILAIKTVPHVWLLPRCSAIIHHGGAGTTAAGLRSGIPNLVVPFAADQPFWGARVHAIGAGPHPIPVKKLTVEKFVAALAYAEGDGIRNGAQAVGRKIRAENGVESLVDLFEMHFKNWHRFS